MGVYVPNTKLEQEEMLLDIGITTYVELLEQIPKEVRIKGELNLEHGLSEQEVSKKLLKLAQKNKVYDSIYRGVGAYYHYTPSIVKQVSQKEEFVTAYTPYQAEISQGTLQAIYEFQTMICELTGMDVSNASVYDGSTAAQEAVVMCLEKKRRKILLSSTMHPQIIETIQTASAAINIEIILIEEENGATSLGDLKGKLDTCVAGVFIQHPNYYGILEDAEEIGILVKEVSARYVIHTNPIALGILKTPREYGADIAIGEGQPLGLPLSFGGPYLGFMATTKDLVRRLPGRIVGETVDTKGNLAYVLTLQAREQHIRREKSTSNICSNQALCALTASVYLSTIGRSGLEQVGTLCMSKAHYLAKKLCEDGRFHMAFHRSYFHEFVTEYNGEVEELLEELDKHNILGGYPLTGRYKNYIIWCVTEMASIEDMDHLISIIGGLK